VEVLPFGALELDIRPVEIGPEDVARKRVRLERVDRLGERPRQELDAEL